MRFPRKRKRHRRPRFTPSRLAGLVVACGFSIFLRLLVTWLQRESEGRAAMTDARIDERQNGPVLLAFSNAMVRLHKEQFGRGPTHARSDFAGPDTLVCTLEDALLPAERTMVEMGEAQRVRESRTFLQVATAGQFIATVEGLFARKVRAFASAIDPGVVWEIFTFQPVAGRADGDGRGG
jgi:uncharacterized protein YbcI